VPAEEGRRPVAPLDQHAVGILVVEVVGAEEGFEAACLAPVPRRRDEGSGDLDIGDVLEEAEDAVPARCGRVRGEVLARADRADDLAAAPRYEELCLPVLEEFALARIDRIAALGVGGGTQSESPA
jgi:hypothetical protein